MIPSENLANHSFIWYMVWQTCSKLCHHSIKYPVYHYYYSLNTMKMVASNDWNMEHPIKFEVYSNGNLMACHYLFIIVRVLWTDCDDITLPQTVCRLNNSFWNGRWKICTFCLQKALLIFCMLLAFIFEKKTTLEMVYCIPSFHLTVSDTRNIKYSHNSSS